MKIKNVAQPTLRHGFRNLWCVADIGLLTIDFKFFRRQPFILYLI